MSIPPTSLSLVTEALDHATIQGHQGENTTISDERSQGYDERFADAHIKMKNK